MKKPAALRISLYAHGEPRLTGSSEMHVLLMSDLHNEFELPKPPPRPTAAWLHLQQQRRNTSGHPAAGPFLGHIAPGSLDLILLAGDIDLELRGVEYADQVARFLRAPVVCVMGNHEGYSGRDLDLLIPELRAAARATAGRVIFLENDVAEIQDGGRPAYILGCTLWTDYALNGGGPLEIAMAMRDASAGLNDHRRIVFRGGYLQPNHATAFHDRSRRWLGSEIRRIRSCDPLAKVIVISHHAPVPEANAPKHRGSRLAPAFASNMRAEISEWQPDLWCFGHTHHSVDMRIDRTRIVAAQRGYVCTEPDAESFVPCQMEV